MSLEPPVHPDAPAGRRTEDMYPHQGPCECVEHCGDDGAIDGPGVCIGLRRWRAPLVEIVLVPR